MCVDIDYTCKLTPFFMTCQRKTLNYFNVKEYLLLLTMFKVQANYQVKLFTT